MHMFTRGREAVDQYLKKETQTQTLNNKLSIAVGMTFRHIYAKKYYRYCFSVAIFVTLSEPTENGLAREHTDALL